MFWAVRITQLIFLYLCCWFVLYLFYICTMCDFQFWTVIKNRTVLLYFLYITIHVKCSLKSCLLFWFVPDSAMATVNGYNCSIIVRYEILHKWQKRRVSGKVMSFKSCWNSLLSNNGFYTSNLIKIHKE